MQRVYIYTKGGVLFTKFFFIGPVRGRQAIALECTTLTVDALWYAGRYSLSTPMVRTVVGHFDLCQNYFITQTLQSEVVPLTSIFLVRVCA